MCLLALSAFLLALKDGEPVVCLLFPICQYAHPTKSAMTKASKTACSPGGGTSVITLGFSSVLANAIAGARRLRFCLTHILFLWESSKVEPGGTKPGTARLISSSPPAPQPQELRRLSPPRRAISLFLPPFPRKENVQKPRWRGNTGVSSLEMNISKTFTHSYSSISSLNNHFFTCKAEL